MDKEVYCRKCTHKDSPRFTPKISPGNLDLLIIGSKPSHEEIRFGPYGSPNYKPLGNILMNHTGRRNFNVELRFAVECLTQSNLNVKDITRCSRGIKKRIQEGEPKVILLLGVDACKAVRIKGGIKSLRGRIFELEIEDHPCKAVVTYDPDKVDKSPGWFEVFKGDVLKAINLCKGKLPEQELDLGTPRTYQEVISSLTEFEEKLRKHKEETGKKLLLAVDTETTSLDVHRQDTRMIAISLSMLDNQGLAYLLDHKDAPYSSEERDKILEATQQVLNPEYVVTCGANTKFDYKWLKFKYGLEMNFFDYDVMLMEHSLDEGKKGEYSLKSLTKDYFPELGSYEEELNNALLEANQEQIKKYKADVSKIQEEFVSTWISMTESERRNKLNELVKQRLIPITKIEELAVVKQGKVGNKVMVSKKYRKKVASLPMVQLPESPAKASFEDIPTDIMLKYAAMDAVVTRKIFARQYPRIQHDKINPMSHEKANCIFMIKGIRDITMPLCAKIAEIEYMGIRVDRVKAKLYQEQLSAKLEELHEIIYEQAGRKFNPNSNELKKILFNEMGLTPTGYTATGAPSTDEAALAALARKSDSPLIQALLTYRKIEKVQNTYIKAWLKQSENDGRMHFSLNQHGTATHRLSSSGTNMQNVPHYLKEASLNIKALLIPDSDEYEFYDMDIANAEMRVLCAYSRDENLIKAFNEGMDIHCLTASGISDFSYDDIYANKEDKTTEQYRQRAVAKKINFGIVYGMGAKSLKIQLQDDMNIKITLKEAEEYIKKFNKSYPGVADYITQTQNFVARNNYTYTFTGRKRRFPMASFTWKQKTKALRQAINARIQTTSADIVNTNIIDLDNAVKPLGGRVVLTVHDSILFQMPKGTEGVDDILNQVIIQNTAKRFSWLPVEWKYDVGKGPNYGECV